jgi:hypothetical protein
MDHKVNTQRIDKRSSKKDRNDGPYSAKHIRNQEKILSSVNSKVSTVSAVIDTDIKDKSKDKSKDKIQTKCKK